MEWLENMNLDYYVESAPLTNKERKDIVRTVRKSRRAWEREKLRIARDMKKLRFDLARLYPDPHLMRALDDLMDEDIPWQGDPDRIRIPLAELLLKCHACGVFQPETKNIVEVLIGKP